MRNKLAKKTGAALVLALMFFLLSACVGVMVVTAASANVGKVARAREEEQRYQAVKAAANAMAQLLTQSPYTTGYTEYYVRGLVETIGADGTEVTVDEMTAAAIKSSIRDPEKNFFPENSKVASLLGNNIRNIFLNNTHLSTGLPLLQKVSESKDGLASVWLDNEVRYLGPDKYELRFQAAGFSDILVTLAIVKEAGPNLFEATITARDEGGSHMVTLSSPGISTGTQTVVNESGTGAVGDPYSRETNYKWVITWDNWIVK